MEKTVKVGKISPGMEHAVLTHWVDVIYANNRHRDFTLTIPILDPSEAMLFDDRPDRIILEGFQHEITRQYDFADVKLVIDSIMLQKNYESRCSDCCFDRISYRVEDSSDFTDILLATADVILGIERPGKHPGITLKEMPPEEKLRLIAYAKKYDLWRSCSTDKGK
jgi:hypothetical protein